MENSQESAFTTFDATPAVEAIGRQYDAHLFQKLRRLPKSSHLQLFDGVARDLTTALPPAFAISVEFDVYDQSHIGSCTANALCVAFRLGAPSPNNQPLYRPSRLFLYYVERDRANLIGQDGAYLDDGFASMKQTGVCSETAWPYVTAKQNVRPPIAAYTQAAFYKITGWGKVDGVGLSLIENMKQVLMTGRAIVFGMLVYSSFESSDTANTGVVRLPNTHTEQMLGGHAMTMVGFDDTKQAFLTANSWGSNWGTVHPSSGKRGYCWLPYAYATNPALFDEALFIQSTIWRVPPPPPKPSTRRVVVIAPKPPMRRRKR
jgi:hypothetical protein